MYYLDFHGLYKQTKRSERLGVRTGLSKEKRDLIMSARLKSQHHICFYCGVEITIASHLDHLIPVKYGGDNRLRNLVASCRSCNMTKSTDQIEITNPYTIHSYKRLILAYDKWQQRISKFKDKPEKYKFHLRHRPKKVRLYKVYRCDLFKEI